MAKYKIRNLNVFETNIWSFYQNILQKMESWTLRKIIIRL